MTKAKSKFAKYRGLGKYVGLLRKTKFQLFIAIISGILYGITSGFGIPIMLKFASQTFFDQRNIPTLTVALFATLPILVMALRAGCEILNAYYIGYCGQAILQEIRVMVFDKIQRLPLEFFKKTEPGELITKSLNDTSVLQCTIIEVSQEIIKQPMALAGAISALVYLCWKQSDVVILLIFICAIPAIVVPVKLIGEKVRKKTLALQKDTEGIMTQLAHNLSAVLEVRAFAMEDSEVSKYRSMCNRVMYSVMKTVKYSVMTSPIIEVVAAAGVGIAMAYTYSRGIGADVFIALTGALYFSYDPIKKLARLNGQIKGGMASFERIEDLLNRPEEITDPQNPVEIGTISNISFNGVHFGYDEHCEVLHGVNIDMKRGKTYALVGRSGAGKTTIINLILRFYDVTSGKVTIDGIDVRDIRLRDLRRNISIVPQAPTLINGTIFENILWSAPGSMHSEVIEAAKKAYAHDFIVEFDGGYDTNVGEGGMRLSGGQKQRIALARAFLRNAPILILDEATSALDANGEHAIHKAIEALIVDKTAILISHRFTMMSIVDRVFVIEKGNIVEEGTPQELEQRTNSVYYSLYQKQRGGRT
ncbi:MAG: ABC transporter ATP-binding protein/permease [Puniceicoccales bacterium]|jgi:subfamily B ATP-binding cassette protein MsbA|nr:ABC transporter ATP-binding protein/permease [Puniceicoccales bacterium]